MKIELRRITYNARLSEETSAYAATVYVDGKKRGDVRNDGHGGADLIRPYSLQQEIDAYAKTLPPLANPYGGEPFPQSAETVFGDLLNVWLAERALKRAFRTKTLFVREGKLYETKAPGPPAGSVALNVLPFDEALRIYREHAGGPS